MADSGRSRRSGADRATKARGALHQLEEQRRSGTKHAAAYEVKDEGAIYDVIDDDEYGKLVAKRRDEAGEQGSSLWMRTTTRQLRGCSIASV